MLIPEYTDTLNNDDISQIRETCEAIMIWPEHSQFNEVRNEVAARIRILYHLELICEEARDELLSILFPS